MGAIAGVYFLDGRPATAEMVDRMLSRLRHRGRMAGSWHHRSVGLGSCAPGATPRGCGPLILQGGPSVLALAVDARLEEREELRAQLEIPEGEVSDDELILGAYRALGVRCADALRGDFSFAIWDESRRRLFCARDSHGVKPFFYFYLPPLFVFASEMKALHTHPEVPRRLNEERVADYLTLTMEDRSATFFEGILRLPPGQTLTLGPSGARLDKYWPPDLSRIELIDHPGHAAETLRNLLEGSVRSRLQGAKAPACLLSGGLDSSSIAWLARRSPEREKEGKLPCYSALFPSVPESDESRYIEAVVDQGGFELRSIIGDRLNPLPEVDRLFHHLEEPVWGPTLFLSWALFGQAKRDGIDILLDGFDGNTTIPHGTAYLAELLWHLRWSTLGREARAVSRRTGESLWSLLWRRALKPIAPQPLRSAKRWVRRSPSWLGLLRPEFAQRVGLAERRASLREPFAGPVRSARQEHLRRLERGVPMYGFEILDKLAAARGVEVRFPFADRPLAEFCLSLPGDQLLHDGWDRWVLRGAMAGRLPDRVVWRPDKSDLSPVLQHALLTFEGERLAEVLSERWPLIGDYLDVEELRKRYREFVSQPSSRGATVLWLALSLALWLRWARL